MAIMQDLDPGLFRWFVLEEGKPNYIMVPGVNCIVMIYIHFIRLGT